MDKKETVEAYAKIFQLKKLLEDYEAYCEQKQIRLKRAACFAEFLRLSGFFVFFALFFYALLNIALCTDLLPAIAYLFMIFLSFIVLIIVDNFSAFNREREEKLLRPEEMEIYRKNKSAFLILNKIPFPKDYMCSGFAEAVLAELKSGGEKSLEETFLKCKYLEFDLCKDKTSAYIVKNRTFIFKVIEFEGLC